jgi:hypothetical protein
MHFLRLSIQHIVALRVSALMACVEFAGSTAVLTVRKHGQKDTEEVHLVRSAGPADRFALLATSLKECTLSEAEIISAVDDLISLVRCVRRWGACICGCRHMSSLSPFHSWVLTCALTMYHVPVE